jgi:hypothetical protein
MVASTVEIGADGRIAAPRIAVGHAGGAAAAAGAGAKLVGSALAAADLVAREHVGT